MPQHPPREHAASATRMVTRATRKRIRDQNQKAAGVPIANSRRHLPKTNHVAVARAVTMQRPHINNIPVSPDHALLALPPLTMPLSHALGDSLSSNQAGAVAESIVLHQPGLRKLLFTYMKKVVAILKAQPHEVQCLPDLERFFVVHHISASSKNGEAYWLQLRTGDLRRVKFVIRQHMAHREDGLIAKILEQLVMRWDLPHLPLIYGMFDCPPARCVYTDANKTARRVHQLKGCRLELMEFYNGGTLREWIASQYTTRKDSDCEKKWLPIVSRTLILQAMFGLFALHQKVFRTHGDAHCENLMVQCTRGSTQTLEVEQIPLEYHLYILEAHADVGRSTPRVDSSSSSTVTLRVWLPCLTASVYWIDMDFLLSDMFMVARGAVDDDVRQDNGDPKAMTARDWPQFPLDFYRFFQDLVSLLDDVDSFQHQEHQRRQQAHVGAGAQIKQQQFHGRASSPCDKDDDSTSPVLPADARRWLEQVLQPTNQPFQPVGDQRAYNAQFTYKPLLWDILFLRQLITFLMPEALVNPRLREPEARVVQTYRYLLADRLDLRAPTSPQL